MTFRLVAAFLTDRASLGRELEAALDRNTKDARTIRRLTDDVTSLREALLDTVDRNHHLRHELGLRAIYGAQLEADNASLRDLLAVVEPQTTGET